MTYSNTVKPVKKLPVAPIKNMPVRHSTEGNSFLSGVVTMDDRITPIWNEELGIRLATVRMMHLHDQSELAKLLGVSQSIVCRIEQGKLRVPEKPFSLADLKKIFPKHTNFILSNSGADSINRNFIVERYWRTRLKPKKAREQKLAAYLLGTLLICSGKLTHYDCALVKSSFMFFPRFQNQVSLGISSRVNRIGIRASVG